MLARVRIIRTTARGRHIVLPGRKLPTREEISSSVQKVIQEVNERIPQYKHIKVVDILTEALEKTTTQKIKRFGNNTK